MALAPITVVAPETVTPPVTSDPNRPAWLPEKFKTAEELAASYTELEKKLGQVQPPAAPPADLSTPENAQAALQAKGLDFKKYEAEYLKDGKISDASMAELKGIGLEEGQVTQFIKAQEVLATNNTNDIHQSVGGKERFEKLVDFAKTGGMSEAEASAYNKAVQSGDYASVKLIMTGLNTRFEQKLGREPNLTQGQNAGGGANEVYANFAAFNKDQRDPRYASDTNFRNSVLEKAKRSKGLLGQNNG